MSSPPHNDRRRTSKVALVALSFALVFGFSLYQSAISVPSSSKVDFQVEKRPDEERLPNEREMQDRVVVDTEESFARQGAEKRTGEVPDKEQIEEADASSKPLNIVLFYADDWTARTLGAVNPLVETPNIDEMGRNGMIFKHNCVTTSICWISRATLYTGVYASQHQQWKIASDNMFNKTISWPDTLYPLLKRHGYQTGFVGKWHHPAPLDFMKYTFDYRRFYYGKHYYDTEHVTKLNEKHALEFLQNRKTDQPFALTVSFFATHAMDGAPYPENFQPQPTSMHLYANETIPLPKTSTPKHFEDTPWFITNAFAGRGRWVKSYRDERFQVTMKNYYRMATEVDAACGRVIDELKRQGVFNNTLLIFTTDNGNLHGQHQLTEK